LLDAGPDSLQISEKFGTDPVHHWHVINTVILK